jgi:hypothetical protein
MRFCSKVYNGIKFLLREQLIHKGSIGNITSNKFVALVRFYPFEVFKVAGIGELIKVNDFPIRVISKDKPYEVAAYEAAAACDQEFHFKPP